jgi:hypothetical protein
LLMERGTGGDQGESVIGLDTKHGTYRTCFGSDCEDAVRVQRALD